MTYILSDIHGEYELFCRLLEKVKFSDGDTLISCGDMIEKGKHSIRLTKLLFSMNNAVLLAGNHEYTFLKYYWALMRQTRDYDHVLRKLQAYFPDDGELLDWETVDRIEALPYFYEAEISSAFMQAYRSIKRGIFCHFGTLPPNGLFTTASSRSRKLCRRTASASSSDIRPP